METRFGFTLMNITEFKQWIENLQLSRTIRTIQNHHTYLPNYSHFTGSNYFDLQRGMKNHHVQNNGWNDIGQHFTVFPDGMICTGRSIESTPACITGNNRMAICIESLGDFDIGKDTMNQAQKDSIVKLNAWMCKRFNLSVDTNSIVYHHWFDLSSGERKNGGGVTKSCPGTAYFGGNKPLDAQQNLIPLVNAALTSAPTGDMPSTLLFFGCVKSNTLNVRMGAGSNFNKVNQVQLGEIVRVYEEKSDWYRISKNNQEWVYANYIDRVKLSKVTASVLNIRSGPGANYAKVGQVGVGTQLVIYEDQNGFSRINSQFQWVSSAHITDVLE